MVRLWSQKEQNVKKFKFFETFSLNFGNPHGDQKKTPFFQLAYIEFKCRLTRDISPMSGETNVDEPISQLVSNRRAI